MLHQLITIYTLEFWMIMLAGVLFFLCLPVLWGEKSELLPITNVIRMIPVVSEIVFAGKQCQIAGNEERIMPYIVQHEFLFRDYRHRLG